jgi:carbon monoxide dehydrogenase subunit G
MNAKKSFLITMFIVGMGVSGATATAQMQKTNYIIVKTAGGEVASFHPATVDRQFIENNNWVFELKETGARHSYPLAEVQPFTVESRTPGPGTGIRPVAASTWNIYYDGSSLVIENPGGEIGRYAVYNAGGQLLKTGYGSGSKVSVSVPSGICIVKAGMGVKKALKK